MLFIDARHIFRQIDRAHRDFTPEQIEFLANIVRLYRGEAAETDQRQRRAAWPRSFPDGDYVDVPGLCKVATLAGDRGAGLEPQPRPLRRRGRARSADEFDFIERLEELNEELKLLNAEARELEETDRGECGAILEDRRWAW